MKTSTDKHARLLASIDSAIIKIGEEIKKSKEGEEALDELPQLQFIESKLRELRTILSREGWQSLPRPEPGMARIVIDTWPLGDPLRKKICEIECEYERLK